MYDALMINVALNLKQCSQYSTKEFYDKIEKLKKDSTFRKIQIPLVVVSIG